MKCVVGGVFPVDVVQRKTFGIAFDGLFKRRAQGYQVVDRFVCLLQAVVLDGFDFLDGGLNVLLAEQVFAAFVADAVYFFELVA